MAAESKEQPREKASGAKATNIAQEVGAIRRAYYQRIREAKGKGQTVAWAMMYGPDELFAAFDIVTVLAENYGPVCAAKQVSDRYCGVAEAEGFSADVCSYLRVGLGMAKLVHDAGGAPPADAPYGGMPKPDFLVGHHAFCDGRYKWMQQLARYLDAPYFGFDIKDYPEGWDMHDPYLKRHMVKYAYEQIRSLVAFLEKMTGRKLDKYRLSEHLRYWMESLRLFLKTIELRKAHPCPLPTQDYGAIAFPNMTIRATKECVDFYQKAYDEIKYRVDHGISSVGEEKYRLMWYWLLPWYYLGLYDWLEEKFGASTIATGYGGWEIPPSEDVIDYDFPLESIARKFYEGFWSHQFMRRSSAYWLRQAELAKQYDIDGAICMLTPSCRGTTDVYYGWSILRDKVGDLPLLAIEADMADTRAYSDVQVKQKLTAFIETIDATRSRRK